MEYSEYYYPGYSQFTLGVWSEITESSLNSITRFIYLSKVWSSEIGQNQTLVIRIAVGEYKSIANDMFWL